MAGKKRGRILFLQVLLLVSFIGVWEIGSRLLWLDPFFFSRPSIFVVRAVRWLTDPGFLLGVVDSAVRANQRQGGKNDLIHVRAGKSCDVRKLQRRLAGCE